MESVTPTEPNPETRISEAAGELAGAIAELEATIDRTTKRYARLREERDELLAALKIVVEMYGPSTEYSSFAAAAWRRAEFAIDKAEGR